jgi:hypothetical protein
LSKGFRQPFDRQLKNGKHGFKMGQLDGEKGFAGQRKGKIGYNLTQSDIVGMTGGNK